MIPILYDSAEREFTTNGLGRLTDCTDCKVTEERNGEFELEFEYPITGAHYSDIIEGRLVYVDHDESKDPQPFEIYRRVAEIDGLVRFYAHHVSYRLSHTILKPFTASSVTAAIAKFQTDTITEQNFTFWTDKTTVADFTVDIPKSARSAMGGSRGSILDIYGGEWGFDHYTVKLFNSRGADNGVTIRYGKNLTELKQTYDADGIYNAVVPYWVGQDGVTVYGDQVTGNGGIKYTAYWTDELNRIMEDENGEDFTFEYAETHTVPMDLTSYFQDQPTSQELMKLAEQLLNTNTPWVPKENIDFDFVNIWDSGELSETDIRQLETTRLCDTVTVKYTALGVEAKAKVIKTVWNPLIEAYDKLELGEAKTSFADAIMANTQKTLEDYPTTSVMDEAIENATSLITGGLGGHVVFNYDAAGKPTEIFVLDTEDINTAVHVLRINVNGIGFSSNGINGPYRTAWTLDGNFVADFITTGTLTANLIRSGVLASKDGSSYWDLDGSVFRFYDRRFDSYVELDEGYISFGHAGEVFGRLIRRVSGDDDVLAIESGDRKIYMSFQNGSVRIWNDTDYVIFDEQHLRGKVNNSKFNVIDNGDFQYIDLNAGGSTWIRVDGKDDYIRMNSGQLIMNGYGGYTGSVTISGHTFTIRNGIITNVT